MYKHLFSDASHAKKYSAARPKISAAIVDAVIRFMQEARKENASRSKEQTEGGDRISALTGKLDVNRLAFNEYWVTATLNMYLYSF